MSKKSKIRYGRLIYLISFVWILGLALTGTANAVDPDLIGWWKLNEGSGDVVLDFSGNNNSGTIQNTSGGLGPGGAVWETDPERGPVLSFNGDDGSGAYVSAGNTTAMTLTNSFTWAFWSKQDAGQATNNDVMLGNRYGATQWIKFTPSFFEFGSNAAEYAIDYDDLPGNTWTHHTVVKDGMDYTYYRNGVQSGTNNINRTCEELPFFMGGDPEGERWRGWMSDVRIYSRALTEGEIQSAMQGERYPYALGPDPEDGAVLTEFMSGILGYSLGWKAGDYAVSHDVYFGENFDDVNDGTGDTFRGNQSFLYFLAGYGYTPNDPVPSGFVPGTTYYWRIDEVNDTDPNNPWKGDVWSFSLPATKAYTPSPADGSKFIDPNADLSWVPGFGAVMQTVYLGDDYDTVANAIEGGTGVGGGTTYDPGPLEYEKTYYWRVDADVGAFGQATGDVWSFRTLPDIPLTSDPNLLGWWKLDEGYGAIALDWSGHENHGTIYNANGGLGIDGSAWDTDAELGKVLSFNGDNSTGTYVSAGHIPAMTLTNDFTWIFWTRQHQDQGMEVPGQGNDVILGNRSGGTATPLQFIKFTPNNFEFFNDTFDSIDYEGISAGIWLHHAAVKEGTSFTYYRNGVVSETKTMSRTIDENPFFLGGDATGERWQGWLSDVRIYDRALTQEEVKQAMRGDPLLAWDPQPAHGSTANVEDATPLSWSPGDNASMHDVYFGTDENVVDNADTSTPDIYRGRLSNTSYTPPEVEWGSGPYYWRIDEYNTDGTISKGRLWSFTVADFIGVDNFEDYDAEGQIWWNWVDGLGYVKPDNTSHPGNSSGSEVGDPGTTSFTEETIIHGGSQSMPFNYNNNDPFKLKYSEAKLTLSDARDWTKHGVKALSLWFYGYPASVGSFTDNFDGTYSMTGSGADIWDISGIGTGFHDEFHFAYKTLTGAGTITARVDSVSAAHDWSKAGVMIRETLDANSVHAFACVTPASGVSFQRRPSIGGASQHDTTGDMNAPYWVKLERDLAGNFTVTRSADGSTWEPQGTLQNIPMTTNVYVGLAVTSHDVALTCEAAFSSVTITGNVTGQWASQDIGIQSNDPEPMYVAIANNTGQPAVVVHDDPNAAQIDEWTEWNIDLRDFTGINLADVNSIAVGVGNRNNPQAGGSGKMYFDDIALYRPRCVPDKLTLSEADLNSDCVVDFRDLEIMTGNWLAVEPDPEVDLEADLNSDGTVDFKDYAVLADDWLDEQIWPDW